MSRIALYLRVSTNDGRQTVENQRNPLREWSKRLGSSSIMEFVDEASGAKADRKALTDLLNAAHRREFDVLLLWSLDRLSREGIAKLFGYLEQLKKSGIRVMSLNEPWMDTQSPTSELLISIFGWIAQQERRRIQERIHEGLRRAKNEGRRFGRPRVQFDVEKAKQLKAEGMSLRQIAISMKIKRPTLARYLSLSQNSPSQNHVKETS